MPVVLVEIAPPEARAELTRALVDACNETVREGKCTLTADEPSSAPLVVAIVRWDDSTDQRVRVEVGVRRGSEPEWRTRAIDFKNDDALRERWRSVGLTVATLAGEMVPPTAPLDAPQTAGATARPGSDASRSAPASNTTPTPPLSPPESPPLVVAGAAPDSVTPGTVSPATAPHRSAIWFGASAVGGPGLNEGAWRWGARADVGWEPGSAPIFARLSASYSARPADAGGVTAQWETVAAGVGAIVGRGKVTLEPWIGAGIGVLRAAVTDPKTGQTDSGSELGLDLQGGADVVWHTPAVSFCAGLDVARSPAPTRILVKDVIVGTAPGAGWLGALGARFFLD